MTTNLIETMARAIETTARTHADDGILDWEVQASRALAAIEASGYRVVPVEPTEAMLNELYDRANLPEAYADLLAAAPKVTE